MLSRLSSFFKRRNIAYKHDLLVVMGDGTVVTGASVGTVVITGAGVVVLLLPSSEGIKNHQTYSGEWILYNICIS